MTQYSAEFKTKIVLEVLKGDKTINEIASEYNIIPKNIQNWKNIFLANAVVAMEPAKAVKEYKDEIEKLKAKNDEYAKIVGKLTVENNWMSGNVYFKYQRGVTKATRTIDALERKVLELKIDLLKKSLFLYERLDLISTTYSFERKRKIQEISGIIDYCQGK